MLLPPAILVRFKEVDLTKFLYAADENSKTLSECHEEYSYSNPKE
jgi:hypothetical protein